MECKQAVTLVVCVSAGTATSYSISSSLPDGMYFGLHNGLIGGTPIVPLANTSFVVTASNSGGSYAYTVWLEVDYSDGTTPSLSSAAYVKAQILSAATLNAQSTQYIDTSPLDISTSTKYSVACYADSQEGTGELRPESPSKRSAQCIACDCAAAS